MIDNSAFFKLSYGIFVLTSREWEKDNGCIINTVTQITSATKIISISVNKSNLTHDMILSSGKFNVSVLSESTTMSLIEQFGFKKGSECDKFEGFADCKRSSNGIQYITAHTNAYLSANVISTVDCGTHTLFVAEVTEAEVLSTKPSATYAYYFEHIKPKPEEKAKSEVKGYVCKICGYVYEGETLPPDFVCPICGHGADDFEPLQ